MGISGDFEEDGLGLSEEAKEIIRTKVCICFLVKLYFITRFHLLEPSNIYTISQIFQQIRLYLEHF